MYCATLVCIRATVRLGQQRLRQSFDSCEDMLARCVAQRAMLEDSPTGRGGARVGYDAKGPVLETAKGGNSSEPQASESFY